MACKNAKNKSLKVVPTLPLQIKYIKNKNTRKYTFLSILSFYYILCSITTIH